MNGPLVLYQIIQTFFAGMTDIEHDVSNDVVVKTECCLLRKFRNESDKLSNNLECFYWFVSSQLLHEVFEKQIAVLYQARPDDL